MKSCHRCLLNFNSLMRLIIHLMKDKKCAINNTLYDTNYEQILMSELKEFMSGVDQDIKTYIIKNENMYKCQLCEYKSNNKYIIKRHLLQTCLFEKYQPNNKLIELISYSQNPQSCPLIKNNDDNMHILAFFVPYIKVNKSNYQCLICNNIYIDKLKIYEHIDTVHPEKRNNDQLTSMAAIIRNMQSDIKEMKQNKPIINNNHLTNNISVYLQDNGDALKLLENMSGDFPKSLEFIKDCALSSLNGDCRLIERIYFSNANPNDCPIRFLDPTKKKIEYINEKKEKVIDIGGLRLARILASNLQNSYLQGVNYLITTNLNNQGCPIKFLGDYDIQSWNNHIYDLCDYKYQKKIIGNLDIPVVKTLI